MSGICPEAIALLQDQQFTPDVTRILRNMKAARHEPGILEQFELVTNTVSMEEALQQRQPAA